METQMALPASWSCTGVEWTVYRLRFLNLAFIDLTPSRGLPMRAAEALGTETRGEAPGMQKYRIDLSGRQNR
jgi:hypothetical protein